MRPTTGLHPQLRSETTKRSSKACDPGLGPNPDGHVRAPEPHLLRVQFGRQQRLQVYEQRDGDVRDEVEAQQPLDAAPGGHGPHVPSRQLRGC